MADYHFSASVISRTDGRSSVAAAAYRSGERLYNDYDGLTHDYTKKRGVVHTEILLPPNAPAEWKDRQTLWNAVEASEKSKDSRLAREFNAALPIELTLDEWIPMVREYVQKNYVDKGMCADIAIHVADEHNPHVHVMLTMRPLDAKGKWQAKTQKEYLCVREGEEKGFTAEEFKAAEKEGWERQYQYKVGKKKVYMTPSAAKAQGLERASKHPKSTRYGRQNPITERWNSEEQLLEWRREWQDAVNHALEEAHCSERVDCRSFKDRGIDEQPTIHEGFAARKMEMNGRISERRESNRTIQRDNLFLRFCKERIQKLREELAVAIAAAAEKLPTIPEIAEALEDLFMKIMQKEFSRKHNKEKYDNMKSVVEDYEEARKEFDEVHPQVEALYLRRIAVRKELDALPFWQIFKRSDLEDELKELEEKIPEIDLQERRIIRRMGILGSNKKFVDEADQRVAGYRANMTLGEGIIKKQDEEIRELYSEYREEKKNVTDENAEEVEAERSYIRGEKWSELLGELRKDAKWYSSQRVSNVQEMVQRKIGEHYIFSKKRPEVIEQEQREAARRRAERQQRRKRRNDMEL